MILASIETENLEFWMKGIFALRNPIIYTTFENPPKEFYKNWGKFLKFGWDDGRDILFHPIFSSLWPGLWLKKEAVRKLYWWEWIEYYLRLRWGRIKIFVHYQILSIKYLWGK